MPPISDLKIKLGFYYFQIRYSVSAIHLANFLIFHIYYLSVRARKGIKAGRDSLL